MTRTLWGFRTNFSLGESIIPIKEGLARAKTLGYTHVAIADTMSVNAIIDATKQAKKLGGVEIISGVTLNVQLDEKHTFSPKLYAMDEAAFTALFHVLSVAEKNGKRGNHVYLGDLLMLLNSQRYLLTTGDAFSAFSSDVPNDTRAFVLDQMRDACSASRFAIELVAQPGVMFARQNVEALDYADRTGLPCIMSQFALYELARDGEARDVMRSISKNQRATSRARHSIPFKTQFIRDADTAWKDLLDSVRLAKGKLDMGLHEVKAPLVSVHKRSDELADLCAYRWKKAPISLPVMAPDEFKALCELCGQRWKARVEEEISGYKPDPALLPQYRDRLKMELKVLKDLGFSNYFLLVSDLVTWAKAQGIAVGPGRGSVSGSLVAFILGITDVDPIRFNLIFERFINPERLDLPDADLDFMSERRHEVVEYLKGKYGADKVAGIANYNGLGPPSAVREVARMYELPEQDYAFTGRIPKLHGISETLEEAVKAMPELEAFAVKYPKQWELARLLQKQFRSMGTHAAGVVVAAVPLTERAVVEARGDDKAINWDKRVCEEQGLVKMDILGLSNLDVLRRALDKIEYSYAKKIELLQIPIDDAKTMYAFGMGDTVGVFQFESSGMKKLLRDLRKGGELVFEDLMAATALYRPGPLDSGLLDDFVAIRQGVSMPHYMHTNMEAALKPTHSVIVYQEQVMQIARDLAGFSMADADRLRSAMGKKDKEKMATMRVQWIEGCDKHSGMALHDAEHLWDMIEKFAGYAFNRSHSCTYALISYWTMWLKQHYPHEFYAATLEVLKEEKLQGLTEDAGRRGIELLPPDINEATSEFRRVGDHLMIPFNRVKQISELTQKAILTAREKVGGRFTSVPHFIENVERRRCNVRHQGILRSIGAFASLEPGSLPARHADRVRDQRELLPGLIVANVRVERGLNFDKEERSALQDLIADAHKVGGIVVSPRIGRKPKFMCIVDAPNSWEESAGTLLSGDAAETIKEAVRSAGLSFNDCYFTMLCRSAKKDKKLSNEEINTWSPFLRREIEILKPQVILSLGSMTTKFLCPDEKGSAMDLAGKLVWSRELDANVVIGINPASVFFDNSKQDTLNAAFQKVFDLVNT